MNIDWIQQDHRQLVVDSRTARYPYPHLIPHCFCLPSVSSNSSSFQTPPLSIFPHCLLPSTLFCHLSNSLSFHISAQFPIFLSSFLCPVQFLLTIPSPCCRLRADFLNANCAFPKCIRRVKESENRLEKSREMS